MTLAAGGIGKLIEECGELVQILGKKLEYYHTDDHPDGAGSIKARMEEEIADVQASCILVTNNHDLDHQRIMKRIADKLALYSKWDKNEESGSATRIDAPN